TASIKATPLKEQNAAQVQADRKRCDEWAKSTASVRTGFATCLIAAGYEATSEVGSTSQTVRLAGASRTTEPTNVLLDVLQCDSDAQREAERNLGMITSWMRDTFGWKFNTGRRQQAFIDCLKPRGYEIGRRGARPRPASHCASTTSWWGSAPSSPRSRSRVSSDACRCSFC